MRSLVSRVEARGRFVLVLLGALMALGWCCTQAVWADEWPCHMVKQIDGDTLMDQFGMAVANVQDMDGDSYPDYIVGAPSGRDYNSPPTYPYVGAGFVRVYSTCQGCQEAVAQQMIF